MDIDIDARGLKCPEPVMKAREALSGGGGTFSIMVDNEAARDNVTRFADTSGCKVEVESSDVGFMLRITPPLEAGETARSTVADAVARISTVVFIGGDEIGRGERELGTTLMKAFLYSCTESEDMPAAVVLMNTGVRLATENDEAISHLKKLEELGTEVVACGTCLDYYGLKEQLKVGRVSNMFEIQSILSSADRLVSL